MSDELANYATCYMEAKDPLNAVSMLDQERIVKNFDNLMKINTSKVSLHQLYDNELKYLENLQCRATFFNILAFGYKTQDEAMNDIERGE